MSPTNLSAFSWDSPTFGQAGSNVHIGTCDDLGDHGRHSDETSDQ